MKSIFLALCGLLLTLSVSAQSWLIGPFRKHNAANPVLTPLTTTTFDDPIRPAQGIEQVMVNGRVVWKDGQHTGVRPGRALRLQDLAPFRFDNS